MTNIQSQCPVCDEQIAVPDGTEESEILNCTGCDNRVVVVTVNKNSAVLEEAPEIEEDWGE